VNRTGRERITSRGLRSILWYAAGAVCMVLGLLLLWDYVGASPREWRRFWSEGFVASVIMLGLAAACFGSSRFSARALYRVAERCLFALGGTLCALWWVSMVIGSVRGGDPVLDTSLMFVLPLLVCWCLTGARYGSMGIFPAWGRAIAWLTYRVAYGRGRSPVPDRAADRTDTSP
jgi:hypothetical protein